MALRGRAGRGIGHLRPGEHGAVRWSSGLPALPQGGRHGPWQWSHGAGARPVRCAVDP
jgi:hypothetical protein